MKDKIIEGTFYVWAAGVSGTAVYGIGFAIFSLITGNYSSSMSFEF